LLIPPDCRRGTQQLVKALSVAEGLEGRHLHEVGMDNVVGTVAAEADVGAGVAEEGLNAGDAGDGIEHRSGRLRECAGRPSI
jgi:hypothetical protein